MQQSFHLHCAKEKDDGCNHQKCWRTNQEHRNCEMPQAAFLFSQMYFIVFCSRSTDSRYRATRMWKLVTSSVSNTGTYTFAADPCLLLCRTLFASMSLRQSNERWGGREPTCGRSMRSFFWGEEGLRPSWQSKQCRQERRCVNQRGQEVGSHSESFSGTNSLLRYLFFSGP